MVKRLRPQSAGANSLAEHACAGPTVREERSEREQGERDLLLEVPAQRKHHTRGRTPPTGYLFCRSGFAASAFIQGSAVTHCHPVLAGRKPASTPVTANRRRRQTPDRVKNRRSNAFGRNDKTTREVQVQAVTEFRNTSQPLLLILCTPQSSAANGDSTESQSTSATVSRPSTWKAVIAHWRSTRVSRVPRTLWRWERDSSRRRPTG